MAAAVSMAMSGSCSSSSSSSYSSSSFLKNKIQRNRVKVNRVAFVSSSATTALSDPYQTLSVNRGASENDVKKAFRRLALQYHPDVCKEDNCTYKFLQINEAYDTVMSNLRGEIQEKEEAESYYDPDEQFRGMEDSEWDLWEEWMGWEGAGIRDYSSHVNPYI